MTYENNANEPDVVDRYLQYNSTGYNYSTSLEKYPRSNIVILTCMDARINVEAILGIQPGEVNILRNSGGIATDDMLRSIALSQNALGTQHIMLIHHTDCAIGGISEDALKRQMIDNYGMKPSFSFGTFDDPYEDVVLNARIIEACPFIPNTTTMRGFVYNVETGLLEEVSLDHQIDDYYGEQQQHNRQWSAPLNYVNNNNLKNNY